MKKLVPLIYLALVPWSAAGQVPVPEEYTFTVKKVQAAIPYVPFKIEDFCKVQGNDSCQQAYKNASEVFHDATQFKGTIGEYIKYLNDMEKVYNQAGQTLRSKAQDALDEVLPDTMEIPTSREELKRQLLQAMQVESEEILKDIIGLPPKKNCTQIPTPPPAAAGVRVEVPGVVNDTVGNAVKRLNEQQAVLCGLGIDVLAGINLNGSKEMIQAIIAKRDQLLDKYKLSPYSNLFSMEAVETVETTVEVVKEIEALIEAKGVPSAQQVNAVANRANTVLPPSLQIPDIPNIPSPIPPVPRELELKKRKDWSGFNYGKRERFATYANAYLDLRGSEEKQAATAFGAAGVYILKNEINVIGGYGMAYAGPDKVALDIELKFFGMDVMPAQHYEKSVKIVENVPDALGQTFKQSYRQTFMAGPIPVSVEVGGAIGLGVGYEYGIYTTKIGGEVKPYAIAMGYAKGSAGIPSILAVGAAAEITIIDAKIPIYGTAGLKFDSVGYPFLELSIGSRLDYSVLDGRAYAYAEYVVPRWGLPPWKKKKAEYNIFKWDGMNGNLSIMSWGLELGRNGAKLTGDLLDQKDRKEAKKLQEAITIQQRKEALVSYQSEVQSKAQAIFEGINKDLASTANTEGRAARGKTPADLKAARDKTAGPDIEVSNFLSDRADEAS